MSLATFTTLHVVISLVGLLTGGLVLIGMVKGREYPYMTPLFLITAIATSVTGFMFTATTILPSHIFGMLSLVVLTVAVLACYPFKLAGAWRGTFIVAALFAFYLNAFVGVVQSFLKVAFLTPLAPTQSEPPFLIAQAALLIAFVAFGYLALKRSRIQAPSV